MDRLSFFKALGLRLKYSYHTEDEVIEEIKEYPSIGAQIQFIFDDIDARWDEAFSFEVTTFEGLDDAWEKAMEVVSGGLRHAIISGIKLN